MKIRSNTERYTVASWLHQGGVLIEKERPPMYLNAEFSWEFVHVNFVFDNPSEETYFFTPRAEEALYRQEGDNEPQPTGKSYPIKFIGYSRQFSIDTKVINDKFTDEFLEAEWKRVFRDHTTQSGLRLKLVSRYSIELPATEEGEVTEIPIWTTESVDPILTKEMILEYGKVVKTNVWYQVRNYPLDDIFFTDNEKEYSLVLELLRGGRTDLDNPILSPEAREYVQRNLDSHGSPSTGIKVEIPVGYKLVKE